MMPLKYKKFDTKRRFGVEFEFGKELTRQRVAKIIRSVSPIQVDTMTYAQSINNNSWHVKEDRTCGSTGYRGVEVASFVCSGINALLHIADVAEALQDNGAQVNRHCGLHIHVDIHDFSINKVGILMAYWLKIENMLELALPAHRSGNHFCRKYIEKADDLQPLIRRDNKIIKTVLGYDVNSKGFRNAPIWSARKIWNTFRPALYENTDRRVNLNLMNYVQSLDNEWGRKTVEFRWPEGTLNGNDIKNWVRLFVSFIDHCRHLKFPKNISSVGLEETLSILGLGHEGDDFYILSEGLMETKTWFLERIINLNRWHEILCQDLKANLELLEFGDVSKEANKLLQKMWKL